MRFATVSAALAAFASTAAAVPVSDAAAASPSLSVKLSQVDNTKVKAVVTNSGKDDVDFVSTLEQHMRTELAQFGLVGRDHLSWRGYYVPVKAVVDGDLCEAFAGLPAAKQSAIAVELDRTVGEVLKKLDQLRVTASGF